MKPKSLDFTGFSDFRTSFLFYKYLKLCYIRISVEKQDESVSVPYIIRNPTKERIKDISVHFSWTFKKSVEYIVERFSYKEGLR